MYNSRLVSDQLSDTLNNIALIDPLILAHVVWGVVWREISDSEVDSLDHPIDLCKHLAHASNHTNACLRDLSESTSRWYQEYTMKPKLTEDSI